MAAAGRFVSRLLDDATEALTRRGSVPADQRVPRSTGSGWFSRRRSSGIVGDPISHLPRMAKSLTSDEETRAKARPKVKLGTFSGVFVPTTLNVLSILMFLRFGFILGQSGIVGMMGEFAAC
ncbi:Vacuolar cation-chloride cotransporter [Drechslerella dactyloides]|uniref:Vacuolar cation-chloride cotransporter n=1 Tax=Drechslerella dactyloides TaxID=74499 RepID=A0AAD6J339_DREDA|nr:Vacuolar cation-chloride cotransporter [Drechslerella dactyloides]